MSDSFEFTLHSPLTKEDWNKLTDAELENTMSITYQTPQGKQVKYIKCEVLDKIRAEIEQTEINGHIRDVECFRAGLNVALNVIDKYMIEKGEE